MDYIKWAIVNYHIVKCPYGPHYILLIDDKRDDYYVESSMIGHHIKCICLLHNKITHGLLVSRKLAPSIAISVRDILNHLLDIHASR